MASYLYSTTVLRNLDSCLGVSESAPDILADYEENIDPLVTHASYVLIGQNTYEFDCSWMDFKDKVSDWTAVVCVEDNYKSTLYLDSDVPL